MAIMLGPGVQIDRYELVCPIGEGGMASVWVARLRGKHGFEKLLAFKSVLPRFAEDASFRSMFLDEARIASRIEHPNVCQIFDLGEHEDMLYMVLEYVDGDSLASIQAEARSAGGVPLEIAVRVVEEVCLGLEAAHELTDTRGQPLHVVHRDVSPQNVLMSVQGAVKIIDFGIAHAKDRLAHESSTDWVKGKTNYMAPEQARGETVTRATDIWAAGALLYKLIAGVGPYQGATESKTLLALVSGGAPTPLPYGVPASIAAIILKALAQEPTDRYPTAAALHDALRDARDSLGLKAGVADLAAFASANLSPSARSRRQALRGLGESSGTVDATPPVEAPRASPGFMEMPSFDKLPPRGPVEISIASLGGDAHDRSAPLELSVSEIGDVRPVVHAPPPPDEVSLSAIGTMDPAGPSAELRVPTLASGFAVPGAPHKPPPPEEVSLSAIGQMDPSIRAKRVPDLGGYGDPGSITTSHDRSPKPPVPSLPTPEAPPVRPPVRDAEESIAKAEKGAFMDVRALISSDSGGVPMTRGVSMPSAVNPTGPVDQPHLALAARPSHLKSLPKERKKAPRWLKPAAIAIFVLVFLAMAVRIGVPEFAKQRAISEAQDHGVTMTIDRAGFTFSGVEFFGVRARMSAVPGVVAEISDFRGDYSSDTVHFNNLVLTVTAPLEDVVDALDRMAKSGRAGSIRRVVSVGAKIHLKQPTRTIASMEVEGASFDIGTRSALGDTVKATFEKLTMRTSTSTIGPWSVFVEQDPASRRTRVVFDPPVPDGPTALLVSTPQSEQLTLKIPRTPLARLGVPADAIGLAGEGPDIEAAMEGASKPTGQVDLSGTLSLFGVFRANKKGYDLKIKGGISGDGRKPIPIVKTTAELGPFFVSVTGTVTAKEGAIRIDSAFEATEGVECDRVARAEAQRLGTLGTVLADLARATGVARVTGTVKLKGTFAFDSNDPKKQRLAWQSKDTCGLLLFAQ